ncbi:MAG: hypothetical protein ACRDAM_00255, partial [Casimicrobium sp.]
EQTPGAIIRAIDAITLAPMASSAGGMALCGQGKLFATAKKGGPEIKFPEPGLGLVVTHDMTPSVKGAGGPKGPECDTVVHVFFAGQELKTVKYYRSLSQPSSTRSSKVEEECMYVGSWSSSEERNVSIAVSFYTNDFDDRGEFASHFKRSRTVGVDIGYRGIAYGDFISNPQFGEMSRTKSFLHTTNVHERQGGVFKVAIAVPSGFREAYYYAKFEYAERESTSTFQSIKGLADPYQYLYWRNVCGFTGTCNGQGCCEAAGRGQAIWYLQDHPRGCGKVTKRMVANEIYTEAPCSDLANEGSWASECDDVEAMSYSLDDPPLQNSSTVKNNPSSLTVTLISSAQQSPLRVLYEERSGNTGWDGGAWYRNSPEEVPSTISATCNSLGLGDAVVCSPNINESPSFVVGAPKYQVMEKSNTTFVGVVDGL